MLLERGPVLASCNVGAYGKHGPVLVRQSAGNHSLLAKAVTLAVETECGQEGVEVSSTGSRGMLQQQLLECGPICNLGTTWRALPDGYVPTWGIERCSCHRKTGGASVGCERLPQHWRMLLGSQVHCFAAACAGVPLWHRPRGREAPALRLPGSS
jgi:hypothetical protein